MTTPTSSTNPIPTSPTDNAPTPTSTTAPTSPKPTSPTTSGTKIPTNLTQDDIVIALMGITGSGKSTFISLLADDFVRVGHELSSCTADIEVHSFIYKNTRRVYLIDTPGFDDTNRTDTDVLKLLAFFLTTTYASTSLQLSGIIYCHRISDTRMGGSSLKNLNMFKKLCGEDAYASITLATTMWSNLNGPTLSFDTGVARERELLSRREWWGLMRERGSKVIRHDGSRESALAIVAGLVERREKSGPVVLNIQKEMIDDKLSLEDTAAGQEVERELTQAKKKFQEQIGELQESYDDALKERDEQLAQVLAEQREDLEKKLARAGEAQENLKITFEKLCEEKTAEYAVMAQEMKEERAAREAEYAARASELDRLQEEQEKDAERHRVEREKYETQRAEADKRMQDLLSAQKTTEAERAREDKEKLDRMQAQMEQRFAWERQQAAQQQQAIQAQMAQLQQAKPSSKEKSSLMPLISLFAGVATSGIGLLTLNPTAVLSGIGTALDGLSGAGGEQ